jgi:hypothetical protein
MTGRNPGIKRSGGYAGSPSYPFPNFWPHKREFGENRNKLRGIARDSRATSALSLAGWRILIVWECTLRERTDRNR